MARASYRRAVILVVLALAAGASALGLAERRPEGSPPPGDGMIYDPGVVRVGTLLQGDRHRERVRIRNVGRGPVRILRVTPSCACTIVRAPVHPIPPSGEAEMVIQFDSRKWQGHVEQTVAVLTSASPQPERLKVIADVQPAIRVSPPAISFGRLGSAQAGTATVRLAPYGDAPPLHVTAVWCSDGCLRAHARRTGHGAAVDTVLQGAPVGELRAFLRIRTDSWRLPEIQIPIVAQVNSKWRLSRPSFFFGLVPRGASPSAGITIFGLRRDIVRGVTSTLKDVHVGLEPGLSADAVKVRATVSPNQTQKGVADGAVILTTLDPSAPRLAIPIDAVFQGPKTACCN